MLKKVYT